MRSGDNPARWGGHLKSVLPSWRQLRKPVHHAALPFSEINQLIIELRRREGVAAKALEFTILTAARTGEVIGAVWDEIDFTSKVWTVPASRAKTHKEHRVPLSPRAISILKALPREDGNPFLFIGWIPGKGLGHVAMKAVLSRMGYGQVTVHGFRSCFMDWAHETTSFPKVVIDMALAHVVGDKVEAAYRRGDLFEKRKRLMAEWERFVSAPVAAGKVVALRR
jgi:integrase